MHINQMFRLDGKVAIVTGGGRGLGLELAEGLAEAGAAVVITGRRQNYLDEGAATLKAAGLQVLTVAADVSDPEDVRRVVEATVATHGGIDILVNNAGVGWGAPSLEYPLDKWHLVMNTNLTGAWLMCQAVAPVMIKRGGGRIINVSSVLGQVGIDTAIQDSVPYHASKAGLDGLTRELAVVWAQHGILINSIAPGYFRTRMTAHQFSQAEEQMKGLSPLLRTGEPGELKGAVVFLASAASSFITGQTLNIDGGTTIW